MKRLKELTDRKVEPFYEITKEEKRAQVNSLVEMMDIPLGEYDD
jgi:hypothetical protein